MACNWLMMRSSAEVWVIRPSRSSRRSASGHRDEKKQEDLLDLLTALLKFNCFLSTTVAKQCTLLQPGVYKFHSVITHAAVAQWSRPLPLNREVVSSTKRFLFLFLVCLLTDIQKTFTETERLPFQYVKEHLPKQCLLSDEISY